MNRTRTIVPLVALGVLLGACGIADKAETPVAGYDSASTVLPGLKDGELGVPADYRSWPVFLADVDKVDAKQIRDIYINPVGHGVQEGEAFPHGSASVMEIWNPKLTADGELETDADGKLIKDDLKLIFLMGKSEGAGEMVAPELRNGDWVYAGYQADGVTPGGPDAAACRGCHLPLAEDDWVFRYDEYFAERDD